MAGLYSYSEVSLTNEENFEIVKGINICGFWFET